MLDVAAADQIRNSDHVDNNHVDERAMPLLPQTVKCETKRKRKASKQIVNSDGTITETASGKKKCNRLGRKVPKSTASKGRKAEGSASGSDEELQLQPPNDDLELTMDDLMAIAEEFVKVENHTEHQASNRDCGSERFWQDPMTVSSSNNSGCLLDVPYSNPNSSVTLAREEKVITDSGTVDPAQDMLDLFLGPLLKKPLKEENKSFMKDAAFAYEIERLSQNVVSGEEMGPLMKKKSSLKDKVAMFLD